MSTVDLNTEPGMIATKVTVSDDHAILRSGLHSVLSGQSDLVVVGEAASAAETIVLIDKEQPDVAVVDVTMQDASGISVLPDIRRVSPKTRILLLTMHSDQQMLADAMRAGAHGYLTKDALHEEVVSAVRTLARGRAFVSIPVDNAGLASVMTSAEATAHASPLRPLSARERQVLALFALGRTHREIAHELGVRVKTVETYRSRLGDKLRARNKDELVQWAATLGLVGVNAGGPECPQEEVPP